ncbi:hypothetical protein [Methanothrix sp.]|uniref:hypothetical protein n=1 Tax=Methanothrix sp. TaxID=90426 RepID=UPI001BD3DB57
MPEGYMGAGQAHRARRAEALIYAGSRWESNRGWRRPPIPLQPSPGLTMISLFAGLIRG